MHIPVRLLDRAAVERIVNPQSVQGGAQEAYIHHFFDTQTYVQAGQTSLTFFQTVDPTRTLSNMAAAGQLPDPQFFLLSYVFMDILRAPTRIADGTAGGALDDLERIIKSRSTWELSVADKSYGVFPLTTLHPRGGAVGVIATGSAAAFTFQAGNNGITTNSWFVDQQIGIPPKQSFSVRLTWNTAVVISADVLIRIGLEGVLYRRIL